MRIYRVLFVASTFVILITCYEKSVINIVKDFLKMDNSPTKIIAFVCLNQDFKKYLIDSLNQYSVSLQKVNSSIELHQPPNQQLYLLDSKCANYEKILQQAQEMQLFGSPSRWIFIGHKDNIPTRFDIFVDSRFYLIEENSDDCYNVSAIYKISKKGDGFLEENIAVWQERFLFYNKLNLIRDRFDLQGLSINVSYVIINMDSLNHLWDYRDQHIDTISKLNFLLSNHVLNAMNARGRFLITNTWGYKNSTTGIYSGMVGDLQTKKAELGGTAVFFTIDRMDIIEYIASTAPTRGCFIFRAPPLSYVMNVFTLPFSKVVWCSSFLLVILICVIIYIISRWEWTDEEFNKILKDKRNVLQPNFMDSVMLGLGAICQQGTEDEPRSAAGKVATFFAFIALMFLYTSYSANIVALLQSTSDNINTVDDLLNSRIKLGVEATPYSKYYFETASDPIRQAVYQQKIAPKGSMANFMDIEVGIKRMREEFFAFHVEASRGYKVVSETFQESEKCGLKQIEFWQMIDPWIAIAKNTTYKELFKFGFRKLHESGVQNREYRRLYVKKPVCQGAGSNFISVGLIDCYYAFVIFGIGIFVSLILLIVERVAYRKWERIAIICND